MVTLKVTVTEEKQAIGNPVKKIIWSKFTFIFNVPSITVIKNSFSRIFASIIAQTTSSKQKKKMLN